MIVNGYKFQEVLAQLTVEKETLQESFVNEAFAFPNETKDPKGLYEKLSFLEDRIAIIQGWQNAYNSKIIFRFQNMEMSLGTGIKFLGGLERKKALWNTLSAHIVTKLSNYQISNDETRAKSLFSREEVIETKKLLTLQIKSLQRLIAKANASDIEMDVAL